MDETLVSFYAPESVTSIGLVIPVESAFSRSWERWPVRWDHFTASARTDSCNIIYSERYYFRLDVIRTTVFSLALAREFR